LKAIVVNSNPYHRINDVRVRNDTFGIVSYQQSKIIKFSKPATVHFYTSSSSEIQLDSVSIGAQVYGTAEMNHSEVKVGLGRLLSNDDINNPANVAVVNYPLAKASTKDESFEGLLGKSIRIGERDLTICGVLLESNDKSPKLYFPITLLSSQELKSNPPGLVVEAENVEDVPLLRSEIESFLQHNFKNQLGDFSIYTNDQRVQQAAQGFLLFRVIMGLIVGISVLVGGIGVMNVLLISVTERTAEIGVRKAVGANKRDIVLLFLAESVTVSALGSFAGLILGIAGTMMIIPIIKAITKVPFQAAYTWTTLGVISIIAVVVGIVFGTYPAIRAARLDPVTAIRHE
jgi:putative ABC transport system permease protein